MKRGVNDERRTDCYPFAQTYLEKIFSMCGERAGIAALIERNGRDELWHWFGKGMRP